MPRIAQVLHRIGDSPSRRRAYLANGAATVPTSGYLDRVTFEDPWLHLEGSVSAFDGSPIEGFKVSCDGEVLRRIELGPVPLDPGVAPSNGSAGIRFTIRARLGRRARDRVQSSIVLCTPLVGGRQGMALAHLIHPLLPLPSDEFVGLIGGGSFTRVASEFMSYFVQLGGLTHDSDVLDVGCGLGRMAFMLAHYLKPTARYEGFDIMDNLIESAQTSISSRFPNFSFRKVDVFNQHYNPSGSIGSSEFRFPYGDENFDLIVVTSVFTHMRASDVAHYLDEMRRVLRPGGRVLATCFLLNEESRRLIQEGRSSIPIFHPCAGCFTSNPEDPECAVGYDELTLLGMMMERDFWLRGRYHGNWCGRAAFTSYQDMLIIEKPAALPQNKGDKKMR
jgi:SAM-dependent methyltransferase